MRGLKYGENPGMPAALYFEVGSTGPGVANYEILQENQDKRLGFINVLDLNAGLKAVKRIKELFPDYAAASVSKHDGPCCGIARAGSTFEAYSNAWDINDLAAFGGVLALSDTVDKETAQLMTTRFFECVIAPGYTDDALGVLKQKPDVRVVRVPSLDIKLVDHDFQYIKLGGGLLVQQRFHSRIDSPEKFKVVSARKPTDEEREAALFNWNLMPFISSNSVTLGTPYRVEGVGAGQYSRVDSTRLAIYYANTRCKEGMSRGRTMTSDAFFPSRDSIDLAGISGVKSVVFPLGSIEDGNVIQAGNEYGMSLLVPMPDPDNPKETERAFVHLVH